MRFLVVDDHEIVRDGLAAVLATLPGGSEVQQAATGAAMLLALKEEHAFDAVILDLRLPSDDGFFLLHRARELRPELPVIIFSSSEAPDDVRRAIALGARGYLPKSATSDVLRAALQLMLAGHLYVPPLLAAEIELGGPVDSLTARQLEVLKLIACDLPNGEIAYRLVISEKTVKAHITAIFRVLGVVNRRQAARAAMDRRLL